MCVSEHWSTVCSDHWGYEEATVACKQLGYSTNGDILLSDAHSDGH